MPVDSTTQMGIESADHRSTIMHMLTRANEAGVRVILYYIKASCMQFLLAAPER